MLRIRTAHEMEDLLGASLSGDLTLAPLALDADGSHLDSLDVGGAAVVVSTSGSTGAPKPVALSASAMLASAAATRARLGTLDWVSALPFQYVAGLMTMVRAHEAGTVWSACSADLSDLARPGRPTALSLVPTQLHRALADRDLVGVLRDVDTLLLGGAAASPHLLEWARAEGLHVVTSYGMSETCGGCVYDGVPLPGVDVRLDDEQRIWLGGAMVFDGYPGNPDETGRVLQHGRVRTQDRGAWDDGRLTVLGRFDDVVVSGGVNIDLAALGRVLDTVADVPSVLVGAPHPDWGTALVLVTESDEHDLDRWKRRLGDAGVAREALPKKVVGVAALPRLTSGKIDRRTLAGLVQSVFTDDATPAGDENQEQES